MSAVDTGDDLRRVGAELRSLEQQATKARNEAVDAARAAELSRDQCQAALKNMQGAERDAAAKRAADLDKFRSEMRAHSQKLDLLIRDIREEKAQAVSFEREIEGRLDASQRASERQQRADFAGEKKERERADDRIAQQVVETREALLEEIAVLRERVDGHREAIAATSRRARGHLKLYADGALVGEAQNLDFVGAAVTQSGDRRVVSFNGTFLQRAGGTTLVPAPLAYFNVKDYGAVGDGVVDDTAAIQACFDAVATAGSSGVAVGRVVMPFGTYKITDTIEMEKQALLIEGDGIGNTTDYATRPGRGTTIRWQGAAGAPMFHVVNCWWTEWRNIYFQGNTTNRPSEGIFFDEPTSSGQGTNARHRVIRCKFGRMGWTGTGSSDGDFDYCIRVGGASNSNNDEFSFEHSMFAYGLTAGVSIDNSQSIWGQIVNCLFDHCGIGVQSKADVECRNLTFNRNTLDVKVTGSNQMTIRGFHSENATQHAVCNASGGKLSIDGGKLLFDQALWADLGALPSIDHQALGGSGYVRLRNLWFSNATSTPTHTIKMRGNNSSSTGWLSVQDCVGLSTLANYDIVAGVGAGVYVDIWNRGLIHHEKLTASATLTATAKLDLSETAVSVADATWSIADTSGLQAALDAKAAAVVTIPADKTADYTLVLGDAQSSIGVDSGTAKNVTVPLNSSVAYPVGTLIEVRQVGAGQVTIVATGGVTLRSAGGALKTRVQYSAVQLLKVATDTWSVAGDITT